VWFLWCIRIICLAAAHMPHHPSKPGQSTFRSQTPETFTNIYLNLMACKSEIFTIILTVGLKVNLVLKNVKRGHTRKMCWSENASYIAWKNINKPFVYNKGDKFILINLDYMQGFFLLGLAIFFHKIIYDILLRCCMRVTFCFSCCVRNTF